MHSDGKLAAGLVGELLVLIEVFGEIAAAVAVVVAAAIFDY